MHQPSARHRDAAPVKSHSLASRRDLRVAARQFKITQRLKRIRSVSRIGVTPIVAVLVASGVIGGVAYAKTDTDSGQLVLKPGGSAVTASAGSFTDGQGSVSFELPGRPVGESVYVGVEMRITSAGSRYRAKARIAPDGSVSVGLSKVIGKGAEENLGSQKLPVKVGTGASSLLLEGSVTGATNSEVAVRAWLDGTVTPLWQMSLADDAALTDPGFTRAWGYLSSKATAPMTIDYSELSAKNSSDPIVTPTTSAPTPTVTATSTTPPPTTSTTTPPATTTQPTTTTSTTTAPPSTTSPTVASALAASGARLPIATAVPAGAVIIGPTDSISSGIARTPSGGTLVLRGGTYRQAVGSVNKPITIQAYPHETPVLTGADVLSAWTAADGIWRATTWTSSFGQNQYRPDEIPAGTATGKVEQTYRNGNALKQVATKAQVGSGTFWIDPTSRQLWVGDNPSGATMEVSNRDRAMTLERASAGAKIIGLRFTAYASPHLDNGAMVYAAGNNTTILDSQFDHSSGAGLKIAGTGAMVEHSTFSDNGAEGMTGNRNDNSLVENNAFLRNNADGFKVVGCAMSCTIAGFKTAHSANLKVIDNAFVGNDSNGYWCDLGCTNGTISGNAVSGGKAGLYYEVSSKATISNNYVEDTDTGGIRISGSDHVTVVDNTLHDNVWQLTIYDDPRSSSTDSYSASLGLTWNTTNLVIQDNKISAGSDTTMLLAANATAQVASPGMYSKASGNDVTGTEKMVWCEVNNGCKAYNTVDAWQAASGMPFD